MGYRNRLHIPAVTFLYQALMTPKFVLNFISVGTLEDVDEGCDFKKSAVGCNSQAVGDL